MGLCWILRICGLVSHCYWVRLGCLMIMLIFGGFMCWCCIACFVLVASLIAVVICIALCCLIVFAYWYSLLFVVGVCGCVFWVLYFC